MSACDSEIGLCPCEEVFGFETTFGMGSGVVDGIHGVMPCKDPLNVTDRKCDDDGVPLTSNWIQEPRPVDMDLGNLKG